MMQLVLILGERQTVNYKSIHFKDYDKKAGDWRNFELIACDTLLEVRRKNWTWTIDRRR